MSRHIAHRDPTGDPASANVDKQRRTKNPRQSGNSNGGQGIHLGTGASSKGSRPR